MASLDRLPRLLYACQLQTKGLVTRQSQAFPASAGGPSPHVFPRRHHATGRVSRRCTAVVWGRIDPGVGIGAGAPTCLRRQACSSPSHFRRAIAWCQACVELCLLGREGSILGPVIVSPQKKKGKKKGIVSCIMPWRSNFPCHRMCCGPDTLLWFALSVFRVADMIGIDGHVSFLPPKKIKRIIVSCIMPWRSSFPCRRMCCGPDTLL